MDTYYNVGKMLSEAGKHYGEGILKEYSKRLTIDLGKGYGISNLKRMRQFYQLIEKGAPIGHQLSWSHYRELLPLKDLDEIKYYIYISEKNSLSRDELKVRIKSNEYERLPEDTRNKLSNNKYLKVDDLVKNPILIKNSGDYEIISEKVLHKLIMEDIETFMKELGNSFCFIGSEYKIKIGDRYNYIDLLLFNIKYNCYVVVELKVTEFKAEFVAQVQKYMNYIDKNLKEKFNNDTIGIIICKKENKFVIVYCSDERITVREYELINV